MSRRFFALRRVPLGWRMVSRDWIRFFVTVSGCGVALSLMLFLVGVYGGVKTESNGYVESRPTDVWVAQRNTTNLIRSTSFLDLGWRDRLLESPSVGSVAPLLRLITTLTIREHVYTAFVCGVEPGLPATQPTIVEGRGDLAPGEIVVDRAFARRAGIAIGDTLLVQQQPFRVAGISTGTNAVITQFTFISLADARNLLPLPLPDIVSYLLVSARPGVTTAALAADLRSRAPSLTVLTADEFAGNNLDELRTGLLPILATVAGFGGVVGAAVLTLLLYSSILERREDYALLKAIGASRSFLIRLVFRQSLTATAWGYAFGLLTYALLKPVLMQLVPVLTVSLPWRPAVLIGLTAIAMGLLSAWLPLRRLERIYPGEVFRP